MERPDSCSKEMRLDSFAEATTTDGDCLRVESEGLSVWITYSGEGLNGNHAWFDHYQGNIVAKNPDEEIIRKMLDIAILLRAKVQGDDGEVYGLSESNSIFYSTFTEDTFKEKPGA